jgi:hypothetical protein
MLGGGERGRRLILKWTFIGTGSVDDNWTESDPYGFCVGSIEHLVSNIEHLIS